MYALTMICFQKKKNDVCKKDDNTHEKKGFLLSKNLFQKRRLTIQKKKERIFSQKQQPSYKEKEKEGNILPETQSSQ